MISLRSLSKEFPGEGGYAVKDLSLDILEGETAVLVGPSGCGKTTTLKMINRLIEPTAGSIMVAGSDVTKGDPVQLRRSMGYVIQHAGLLPHKTVGDNIGTVPRLLGWDKARIAERVRELSALLELDRSLLRRYPQELSGGQRQRVGVARALGADPPVLLMDEPFGAVDPIVRERLQDQFIGLRELLNKTIVFVTHDIDEAIKMADRIAILNQGAKVEQFDEPERILREPANEFVEQFVGSERGLRRLALISVSHIGVEEGPVVSPQSTVKEALEEMSRFNLDWVSVVRDGFLEGWVDESEVKNATTLLELEARPFSASVRMESSLRKALDSIVTTNTNVAVVLDEEGRYLGILTLEEISKQVVH